MGHPEMGLLLLVTLLLVVAVLSVLFMVTWR